MTNTNNVVELQDTINTFTNEVKDSFNNINKFRELTIDFILKYGFKIIVCILIFFIGWRLIKFLNMIFKKFVIKTNIDESLRSFFLNIVNITLKALLFITIASILGIDTTSFIAILGAASFAIGLALQGSLSNFAGGILILLLKPFKVGDYIEENSTGHSGFVEDIDIFYSKLVTHDNKTIIVPNGILSNNSIVNHTMKDIRRIDLVFGVDYEESTSAVKQAIEEVIDANDLILKKPKHFISICEHGDSSVNYAVNVWCKTNDYIALRFKMIEDIKIKFDEKNINIPYPHMDIKLVNNN